MFSGNETVINVAHVVGTTIEEVRSQLHADPTLRVSIREAIQGCTSHQGGGGSDSAAAGSFESAAALASHIAGQRKSRDFYFLVPKGSARAMVSSSIRSTACHTDDEACNPKEASDEELVEATLRLVPWPALTVNYGPAVQYAADFFTCMRAAWTGVNERGTEKQYAEALRSCMMALQPLLGQVWDASIEEMIGAAAAQEEMGNHAPVRSYCTTTASFVHHPSVVESALVMCRRFPGLPGLVSTVTVCWSDSSEESYTSAVVARMSNTAAWLLGVPTAARPAKDAVCVSVRIEWLQQ